MAVRRRPLARATTGALPRRPLASSRSRVLDPRPRVGDDGPLSPLRRAPRLDRPRYLRRGHALLRGRRHGRPQLRHAQANHRDTEITEKRGFLQHLLCALSASVVIVSRLPAHNLCPGRRSRAASISASLRSRIAFAACTCSPPVSVTSTVYIDAADCEARARLEETLSICDGSRVRVVPRPSG